MKLGNKLYLFALTLKKLAKITKVSPDLAHPTGKISR